MNFWTCIKWGLRCIFEWCWKGAGGGGDMSAFLSKGFWCWYLAAGPKNWQAGYPMRGAAMMRWCRVKCSRRLPHDPDPDAFHVCGGGDGAVLVRQRDGVHRSLQCENHIHKSGAMTPSQKWNSGWVSLKIYIPKFVCPWPVLFRP